MLKAQVLCLCIALGGVVSSFGQAWESIIANVPGTISIERTGIDSDGTRLYIMGQTGVFVSPDNGGTFSALNAVDGAGYNLGQWGHRFIAFEGGSVWLGTDPGSAAIQVGLATLHRLTPGQTTWVKSSNGFPVGDTGNQADDIAYDASTGTWYVAAALGGAYVSSDGLNWTRATNPGGTGLPATVATFDGTAFFVRPLMGGGVARTVDQGANWTFSATHGGIPSGHLLEVEGRVMYASTGPTTAQDGLYYTDDKGVTWKKYTAVKGAETTLTKFGSMIFAAGNYKKFSVNKGLTWDSLPIEGVPAGFFASRIVRQGDWIFMTGAAGATPHFLRLNTAGVNFTPTTQIVENIGNTNILAGRPFTMRILAGGQNLTYQWTKGGEPIQGATGASYTIDSPTVADSGAYRVTVTGDNGSVTSAISNVNVVVREEGKVDGTYTHMVTGGPVFLLADGTLAIIAGDRMFSTFENGGQAGFRRISGADFSKGIVDSQERYVLAGTLSGNKMRRAFTKTFVDDTSFPERVFDGAITKVIELPGRGYLTAGAFNNVSGVAAARLALIGYDGTVDTASFNIGVVPNGAISFLDRDAAGNIYVSGGFTTWGTAASQKLVRLSPAGVRDASFVPAVTLGQTPYFKVLPNGKTFVVISGRPRMLNADGSLDASFNAAGAVFDSVNAIASEVAIGENGKLYVAGNFTSYGGVTAARYMRLNADGTLDATFNASVGPTTGSFASVLYDARGYIFLVRTSFDGNFQGVSSSYGPYRVFAGLPAATDAYGTWSARYNFPAGQGDRDDDPDADGLANGVEFVLGTDPTVAAAADRPRATNAVDAGTTYPAVTFTLNRAADPSAVQLKFSTSVEFADELPSVVSSIEDLGNGMDRVTVRSQTTTTAQPRQFIRVKVDGD